MTDNQPEENNVTPDHDAVNHPRHLVARAEVELHGRGHYRPRFFRAMVLGDTAAAHDILNTYLEGLTQ